MDLQKEYTDKITNKLLLPLLPSRVTPNAMSWFRLVVSPIIFLLLLREAYVWGGLLFLVGALSDAADGARARIEGKITNLGKILDPIADRAVIGAAAVVLLPRFFGWPLFAVLFVLELAQSIRAHFVKEKVRRNIDANWAGKVKMVIQALAFIVLFLGIYTEGNSLIGTAKYLIVLSFIFLVIEPFVYKEAKNGQKTIQS